ncbi:MAG: AhpC/TSA family protein [Niastella sp.]|nr:AhpC/TSA family protein [Niastella sp.]
MRIRKIIATSLLSAVMLHTQAQNENSFVLKGSIDGTSEGLMYLRYLDGGKSGLLDSAVISNGRFEFKGKIGIPYITVLSLKQEKFNEGNITRFFLQPGAMEVKLVTGAFDKIEVTGSAAQEEYRQVLRGKVKVDNKYKSLLDSLNATKDKAQMAKLRERLPPYFEEWYQGEYDFIRAHPQSPVSLFLLNSHKGDLPLDTLAFHYNRLSPALQQSTQAAAHRQSMEKLLAGSPGSMAKTFSGSDINGAKLSLEDYKGKYVLLDFWASWCAPCRKGNPHLISLYKKYKSKGIEFIGIADDDATVDKWKQAVAKDKIALWRHLLNGKVPMSDGSYDVSNSLTGHYGVTYLPTKILIDPSGKIIGRYGTEQGPLDKQLAEIFDARR